MGNKKLSIHIINQNAWLSILRWIVILQELQTRQFRVEFLVELQTKLEVEAKMEI